MKNVSELRLIRAGTVPYEQAWARQRELHDEVVAGASDVALLLEHPPVYTAGKRTETWERPVDGTPVIDVDRGGKITWHGPGQLVGYPIMKLPRPVDVVGGDPDQFRYGVRAFTPTGQCRTGAVHLVPGGQAGPAAPASGHIPGSRGVRVVETSTTWEF